jgi:hypothetical protein
MHFSIQIRIPVSYEFGVDSELTEIRDTPNIAHHFPGNDSGADSGADSANPGSPFRKQLQDYLGMESGDPWDSVSGSLPDEMHHHEHCSPDSQASQQASQEASQPMTSDTAIPSSSVPTQSSVPTSTCGSEKDDALPSSLSSSLSTATLGSGESDYCRDYSHGPFSKVVSGILSLLINDMGSKLLFR